ALADPDAGVRRVATLAAAMSADRGVIRELRSAFDDREPGVRLAAVAALGAVQAPYFESERAAAVKDLARLARGDPSPSVAASAARLLSQISPAALAASKEW